MPINYDHLNQIHEFWRNSIFPHLNHVQTVASFDDYLKRFSSLPSGQWLRDFEKVKFSRVAFAIDIDKFIKKYSKKCVTYNSPLKPEDGFQRAVYQFSSTLHAEVAFWIWVENEELQSYLTIGCWYNNDREYLDFVDDLFNMRMEGNTDDKKKPAGFLAGISPMPFSKVS